MKPTTPQSTKKRPKLANELDRREKTFAEGSRGVCTLHRTGISSTNVQEKMGRYQRHHFKVTVNQLHLQVASITPLAHPLSSRRRRAYRDLVLTRMLRGKVSSPVGNYRPKRTSHNEWGKIKKGWTVESIREHHILAKLQVAPQQ